MFTIITIILFSIQLLFAWQIIGFLSPTNPSIIKQKIWCYQNKKWKNNFNYGNFPQIKQIEGGEACWVYQDITTTDTKNYTYNWHEGWNLVTPVYENWNLDNKFRGNALIGWRYENGKWEIYNYKLNGFENFNSLNIGDGMWVYIPHIDVKLDNLALFCKDGNCSKIITQNPKYNFYIKAPQNTNIKIAVDLYRYSNNTHYKFAIGPFKITNNSINSNIPMCVSKEGVGESCGNVDNSKEKILSYSNNYLIINAQAIANHFDKSIPNVKENFLVKIYIEGFDLPEFTNEKFGTLGIEGFGTWVSLNNSKRIEFEMDVK